MNDKKQGIKCDCGFIFSGPGEFRNCDAFINERDESCVICPNCGKQYKNIYNHKGGDRR